MCLVYTSLSNYIGRRTYLDKDLIRDYLLRSEMTEGQSEALSQIFGQMARRDDVLRLEDRMIAFEEKMEARFQAFEEKMEARFQAFEEKMDARFQAFEEKMDARFQAFEEKMDARFRSSEERMEARFEASEERSDLKFQSLVRSIDLKFEASEERVAALLATQKSDLTWRTFAIVGFFGTLVALLNFFAG